MSIMAQTRFTLLSQKCSFLPTASWRYFTCTYQCKSSQQNRDEQQQIHRQSTTTINTNPDKSSETSILSITRNIIQHCSVLIKVSNQINTLDILINNNFKRDLILKNPLLSIKRGDLNLNPLNVRDVFKENHVTKKIEYPEKITTDYNLITQFLMRFSKLRQRCRYSFYDPTKVSTNHNKINKHTYHLHNYHHNHNQYNNNDNNGYDRKSNNFYGKFTRETAIPLLALMGFFNKISNSDIDEERQKLTDEQRVKKMKPVEILIAKGVLSMYDQDYAKANELFHKALQLSQDEENDEQELLVLNLLASNYFESDDFENAEKSFIHIMKRMIANNYETTDPAILELSLKLASIYSKNPSTQDRATEGFKFVINSLLFRLEELLQSNDHDVNDVDLNVLSDDKKNELALLGWGYDWFAKHLLLYNDYRGAVIMLKRALDISKKVLGPLHDQTLILLNDVGTAMAMNGEPEEGKTFLLEAVEGAIESQSGELASFYVNLGLVNLKLNKFHDAKRYCEYSIELATKNGDHHNSVEIIKLSQNCLGQLNRLLQGILKIYNNNNNNQPGQSNLSILGMDFISKCIIFLSNPILLYIAQCNYKSLLSIIVLANPFTLTILISGLNYYTRENHTQKTKLSDNNINNNNNNLRQFSSCCSYENDKIFLYFKLWIISAHLTFMLSFEYYVVPSLTITIKELSLLYGSYLLLLILIMNLKYQVFKVTMKLNSSFHSASAMPLTEKNHSTASEQVNKLNNSHHDPFSHISQSPCGQLCYLQMLAYPIIRKDKNLDWINENGSISLKNSSNKIDGKFEFDDYSIDKNNSSDHKLKNSMVSVRKLIHYDLESSRKLTSTQNNYLLLCNIIHLFILAQMFYLNITYTCACNTSKLFGRNLLIPMECSNVYDNLDARSSMFVSIYSGQLLFCHAVFLLRYSIL